MKQREKLAAKRLRKLPCPECLGRDLQIDFPSRKISCVDCQWSSELPESPGRGLRCPRCESRLNRVLDNRRRPNTISRVRICLDCGDQFRTVETLV